MRMIARSAVDAPVAMLRVNCSCPGVSARMNLRRAVEKNRYAFTLHQNPYATELMRRLLERSVGGLQAIDTEAIVKGVYLGIGVPSNGPISPSSWAYDDTIKPIKRDLDKDAPEETSSSESVDHEQG